MKSFLICSLLCVSLSAAAQFTQDTLQNTVVHELAGSEQSVPLTATTTDGSTYVSWFDNSSGQYVLRMQLLDKDGVAQWASGGVIVSNFPQNSALFRYDLKVDNEDNAIVAFQDERTGSLQVVVYKISPSGLPAWGGGLPLQDSIANGLSPEITVTGTNDIIVAWNASLNNFKWVAYAKIAAGGQLQWIKRIWNNQKYSRGVLLPASASGFQMLYVQETGNFPSGTSTMYLQRFDSSGTAQWPNPVQVSSKTITFFFYPEIISDGQDGIFIAFTTGNPSNPALNDVYAQHVDSAGVKWSATGTQCANSSTDQKILGGFCKRSAGNELCVAIQVLNSSQSSSGISMQCLDASGNRLLGANALNLRPISSNYYLPVAITDLSSGLMITYMLGGFGNQTLHGLFCDYSGTPQLGYDPMIAASLNNKDDVQCGPYMNGQVVLVWKDDRVDAGIYAQNIRNNGSFGPLGVNELANTMRANIHPNPGISPILSVWSSISVNATLVVENALGETVYAQPVNLVAGSNSIQIPLAKSAGVYLIRLQNSGKTLWQGKWIRP